MIFMFHHLTKLKKDYRMYRTNDDDGNDNKEMTQICYEARLINENTANYYMLSLANMFKFYHLQYRLFSF